MDKQLRDLIDIIHFTEKVAAKIHGLKDETEIHRVVEEEFVKSKYSASLRLLTEDGSSLKIAWISHSPELIEELEQVWSTEGIGVSVKDYEFKLNNCSYYRQVVEEGKTLQVKSVDLVGELFTRQLAKRYVRLIGDEDRRVVITPLKRRGKNIGVLTVSSTELAEHFTPTVRNLAHHISTALELAAENADRTTAEKALRESEEKHRILAESYERLTDNANEAIFRVEAEGGHVIHLNAAAERIFGYSQAEWLGDPALGLKIIHPDYKERQKQIIEEINTAKKTIKNAVL